MKKEEIDGFIEDRFKQIAGHFRKAIDNFEPEDIREFRAEIKKLKVFLHLLSMESDNGSSCRITKRIKTIYGYLGIVQNFQLQLKKTKEYVKESVIPLPVCYENLLKKELNYWKQLSKDYIDTDYSFLNDKKEMISTLPDKLTQTSIKKFIHYTLYELNTISGRLDDVALDNARKFMEDIYYNYTFIKPYITQQQSDLFNEKQIDVCLELFNNYRNNCIALSLLQTFGTEALDDREKQILKKMENDWLSKKKELRDRLSATLDSIHIKFTNLSEFTFSDSSNE
jgi:hypothetical protein